MELSTPSFDPEPQEPLPLRQREDLEPSTAEHRGEEAGAVHVSVWGGGATQEGVPQSWVWAWNKGWPHTTHLSHCSQSASYAGYSLLFSGKLSVPIYTHQNAGDG